MTLSFNKLNEIAEIYESIAFSEQEILNEIGGIGGQKALDKVRSNMAAEKQSNAKLDAARAQRFGAGSYKTAGPAPKAAKQAPTAPGQASKGPMTAFQAGGGNAKIKELSKGRSSANAASIERIGQDNLFKAGGGQAAIDKGPKQSLGRAGMRSTLTRQDIINRGTVASMGKPTAPAGAKQAPTSAKSAPSQYTKKNLGGAQYAAFKGGGGDEAIRQGRSAGEVVAQGRKNLSKVLPGREMNMLKQDFDVFDVVLGHLIDEGYADTQEAATAIMANMSEAWVESIVENRGMAYSGGKPGASGDGGKPTGITGGTTYKMKGWDDDDAKDAKKAKVKGV